jgi:hypothetical protein
MTKKQYNTPNVSVGTVKEIHGSNGIAMIPQEGQPAMGRIWRSHRSSKPS